MTLKSEYRRGITIKKDQYLNKILYINLHRSFISSINSNTRTKSKVTQLWPENVEIFKRPKQICMTYNYPLLINPSLQKIQILRIIS